MNVRGKAVLALVAVSVAAGLGYYLYERNIEQADYRVVVLDGDFEIREYPALLVAESVQHGSRDDALNRGFRALADFIFAKSREGEKIAMTAPVTQHREPIAMTTPVTQDEIGPAVWRTRFVMPAHYSRTTLPRPTEGVTIGQIPPRRLAALRFNGPIDDEVLAVRQAELRRWLSDQKIQPSGQPEYAFYNSPFIPAFLRRNEILLPLPRA